MSDETRKQLQQSREELMRAAARNPEQALDLALYLRRRNEQIPDYILNAVVSVDDENVSPEEDVRHARSVAARRLAEDYITTDDDVPSLLLNVVAQEPKDAYYLAMHYKKYRQQIPEIILRSVMTSQWASVFSSKVRRGEFEDEETSIKNIDDEFRQKLFNSIMKDPNAALKLVGTLTFNKKPIPEALTQLFMKNSAYARDYATVVLGNEGTIPDEIMKELAKDPAESYRLADDILQKYGRVAPDEIVHSLSKNAMMSSEYAVAVLKKKIINHRILKILEKGMLGGKTKKLHRGWSGTIDYSEEKPKEEDRTNALGDYAIVYSRELQEMPSAEILNKLMLNSLTYVASNLTLAGKPVPQEMIDKVASSPDQSYRFVGRYYLKFGTRNLPKQFKKISMAAKEYNRTHI